jgi:hypothetical protein
MMSSKAMADSQTTQADESPFGYPALMDGYPLAQDERDATSRLLSEYERRHRGGKAASGGEAATTAEPQPI